MNYYDGTIELEREVAALNAALAAEREKVATLTDRVRGLEGALQPLVPNQHGDYGGPLVAGKWWFEDGSEQVISSDNGIKAANALTPPAPAGPVTLKPGHDHDDNDPYMPAPAKAAREGGAQT